MSEKRTGTLGDFLAGVRKMEGLPAPMVDKFEFTLPVLEAIEFGHREHGKTTASQRPDFQIAIGALLGETIVRAIPGAVWENPETADLWDAKINVPVKEPNVVLATLLPMQRARKFYKNHEDSLLAFYYMAVVFSKYTMEEAMQIATHKGDGWYLFPEGFTIRMLRRENVNDTKGPIKETDRPVILEDGKLTEKPIQSKYRPGYEADRN